MPLYRVLSPIKVGQPGRIRKPADRPIRLSAAEAALAEGFLEEVKGSPGTDNPGTDNKKPASSGEGVDPASKGAGESSLVNVNTASAAAIAKAAKGIGPATAKDLVKHRKTRPFESLDDLARVGGISQALVDANRDVLTV